MLGGKVLDDGLDDPVGIREAAEVVLDIAGPDQTGQRLVHEAAGLHLSGNTVDNRLAPLVTGSCYVEEIDFHAGIGELGGDATAHRACANHRDTLDREPLDTGGQTDGGQTDGGRTDEGILAHGPKSPWMISAAGELRDASAEEGAERLTEILCRRAAREAFRLGIELGVETALARRAHERLDLAEREPGP